MIAFTGGNALRLAEAVARAEGPEASVSELLAVIDLPLRRATW